MVFNGKVLDLQELFDSIVARRGCQGRDHRSVSLIIFSKSISVVDPALAVKEALAISLASKCPSKASRCVRDIIEFCIGICREILEIPREANETTDRLAKAGVNTKCNVQQRMICHLSTYVGLMSHVYKGY
ncbi:hypothetical protein Goklo_002203 [Gossypium klotzschianum]|uniref:Uncharacterized protein n=1 Tax=Gossypium klotzschianum TaxID=34286 RepID=A0A7J8VSG9_9ROSI|nr:hypothetical protein [Gossypium klotzschianum]